jgi:hypothetical protein
MVYYSRLPGMAALLKNKEWEFGMLKKITLFSILILLCGCTQTYSNGNSNPVLDSSFQYNWDHANTMVDREAEECSKAYKNKKITYYAVNECQVKVMENYLGPLLADHQAFDDYKTQRLLLALRVQKGKLSKDEAKLLMQNLASKMLAAQNAAAGAMWERNQMASQQKNAALLGILQKTSNDYRSRPQQQPISSGNINCTTYGDITNCRY